MYNQKDFYYKKAKSEGYMSRAAYKLIDLNKKFKLIRNGDTVIDLGAAPGGWSQVALELVGPKGKVVGVDLIPMVIKDKRFIFFRGDITNPETISELKSEIESADVALSDMAPRTTGIQKLDQAKSADLVLEAIKICKQLLKSGGNFLTKLFMGAEANEVIAELKHDFKEVKISKPESSRKESKEVYIVAKSKQ